MLILTKNNIDWRKIIWKRKEIILLLGLYGKPGISGQDGLKLILSTDDTRKAIFNNGGIPIIITPTQDMTYFLNFEKPLSKRDMELLDTQISICDGILMPGGYRIYFYDKYICKKANEMNIPLLGICAGMQVMCNYDNDNKNIKVEGHKSTDLDYRHDIEISKSSKLFSIINKEKIAVNSFHTYAVSNSGSYNVCAKANDVIEAVEKPDSLFNIGVQWHPEKLNDEPSKKLLSAFISSALEYSKTKNE